MYCRALLLAGAVFLILTASAAFSEPDWVKEVTGDAAGIVAPDEATAVVLMHTTDVKVLKNGRADAQVRVAFKILTRTGREYATFSQPVYPFLKVNKLKCWVVKPGGQVNELEKDDVVSLGFLKTAGYYDDSQVMYARPPHIEPGDVVAFEVETREDGWTSLYQSFIFQKQQPVRFARFSLTVPEGWEVIYGTWNADEIEFEHTADTYAWTARGLDHQPEEPLAPSWYFLSRRLSVSCHDPREEGSRKGFEVQFPDWTAVAKWVADVYREPSLAADETAAESERVVNPSMTFEEKVEAIAEFCQNDIRYVAIEIGKNRWEPRPAKTTLFNRYGDCKDKSVLMIAMLAEAGIRAVPALCNSYYPVDPRVPSPFLFNHCIVAIPLDGGGVSGAFEDAVVGGWLFFDPTDPTTGVGQLPWSLQGNRVLIGAESDSVLVKLPYPEPEDFRRVYAARGRLQEDGTFSAHVTVTDFGGSAAYAKYARKITPEKDQIEEWTDAMSRTVSSVEISDYGSGEDGDSTWVSFTMKSGRYIQDAGGLVFIRPDFFQDSDPSVLTAKERRFPVWFGPPREVVTDVAWELPEGWRAEVETPEIQHECEAASITCETAADGGGLRTRTVYRQNGELIWPEDYESAKNFSKNWNQVRGQVAMIRRP